MVKQKKHTCITQSRKNYAINCAIKGLRLIWKQKIWLAICKFLWSLTNQNARVVSSFCTELTLFCTVFEKNCTALNQSKWRNFFMYIIRREKRDTVVTLVRGFAKILSQNKSRTRQQFWHFSISRKAQLPAIRITKQTARVINFIVFLLKMGSQISYSFSSSS